MNAIYGLLGLLILALLGALGVQTHRLDTTKLSLAERDKTIAEANAKAQALARETEQKLTEARSEAATKYEEGKRDAEREQSRIVAGLGDGTIRLRREWAACETNRLSEGAAAERELGAAEQRRREGAARIVRAADECDAHTRALIEDAAAVRSVINGTYQWQPKNSSH